MIRPKIMHMFSVCSVQQEIDCLLFFSLGDRINIGCSLSRLISRPEHLIGRYWYLAAN
jgi:hypothetical protein